MTLTEFLDKHNACEEGRKRVTAFASLEDTWQNCSHADLLWAATRPGVLTDKELRLFAVFCARSVQHLMTDPRSRDAIEVAERHANGLATDDELRAAYAAAYVVAPATYAARCAANAAADAARRNVALASSFASNSAAYAAAYDVARAAAHDPSCITLFDAAYAAASKRQAEWIRLNTKPNFS
jgi:hypothetical protein